LLVATRQAVFTLTIVRPASPHPGLSSIFAGLAGSLPPTTYAKNNGVLALSNVASRQAGFACAGWTLFLGIFAKFGGWVLSIPNCILGGAFVYLFAAVITSGIKVGGEGSK
jgi:xanthine/uracil permease